MYEYTMCVHEYVGQSGGVLVVHIYVHIYARAVEVEAELKLEKRWDHLFAARKGMRE